MEAGWLSVHLQVDNFSRFGPLVNQENLRRPGIEPGPPAWKAGILTTELSTHRYEKQGKAFDGIRTRDLSLTKRVLCQLSYEGINGESGFRSRCLVVANDALYRLS